MSINEWAKSAYPYLPYKQSTIKTSQDHHDLLTTSQLTQMELAQRVDEAHNLAIYYDIYLIKLVQILSI